MEICNSEGFDFYGYYDKFPRSGCWFCPLQRVDSLKKIYLFYPEKWSQLKQWQLRAREHFSEDYWWKLGGKDLVKYEEKWRQETNDA